ncbi:hypothetical protein F2P45_20900 [Massilia sp. CCM 8733]|uniref:Uncharacterized protein n=1 Tax=Massilia mucilaginosa TaxID=2609282 RepID=A0ABX0NXJ6_9BURK|nr:hypothetical protein [Massilia mucilaginosa]NHZ91444.1 hypothetical protein [Massilia mucilaginosa]
MQKMMSELSRLYLPAGALSPDLLAQRRAGHSALAIELADGGMTRAVVIPFRKLPGAGEAQHWAQLCVVANALQAELGFPAPAVSISGSNGYYLWMSLEAPTPIAQVRTLLELIRKAYVPEMAPFADAAGAAVELPPCLDPRTGKWAAFIDAGLGAAFAEESGLEMAPPLAAQAALLERLERIGAAQFQQALDVLGPAHGAPAARSAPAVASAPEGLLLRDATLEDIVRFLHAKKIEPTFRHLIS